ncbi:helix-turn-helix domain-containing protein [Goodfellowiella coeruleoviolacea]|uniref:Transcriptional regulator, contains XRE-family HTH domain n=1 Tax=Goodfellowiella coeruleoviolacea TaxID=334858 RepID=A0AAE3GI46_9PSEU|nr:helix-turn-helix transcriptional regulator [Goodfellowiella coeruleoviolacea]MCP2168632.1 Transcriptional regulator, contains XRE-family HTH domain [Goodfellowiella coeruleoviolacea]
MDFEILGIGQDIRRLRECRGMTLDALAGHTGLGKGYLSKIENGLVVVDRWATLARIASALRVSTVELGERQSLADRGCLDARAALPEIRAALLASSLDEPVASTRRTIDELGEETTKVAAWHQDCHYAEAGRALPRLLTDLHAMAAAGGADRPRALHSTVQATQTAALLALLLGAADLAWLAADRGHEAALRLDDPLLIAAAEYARTRVLIGLGAFEHAGLLARRAVELLRPRCDSEAAVEVYGTSLLTVALCAALLGTGDPGEHLSEAAATARRTSGSNAYFLAFSPLNVELWRVGVALEAGDPLLAAEVAARVRPADIPVRSRRNAFLIDQARALHALRNRDSDVVDLLVRAEKLAPVRTRRSVWAREIVAEVLQRARRDAGGPELHSLADRMGLGRGG